MLCGHIKGMHYTHTVYIIKHLWANILSIHSLTFTCTTHFNVNNYIMTKVIDDYDELLIKLILQSHIMGHSSL